LSESREVLWKIVRREQRAFRLRYAIAKLNGMVKYAVGRLSDYSIDIRKRYDEEPISVEVWVYCRNKDEQVRAMKELKRALNWCLSFLWDYNVSIQRVFDHNPLGVRVQVEVTSPSLLDPRTIDELYERLVKDAEKEAERMGQGEGEEEGGPE